MADRRHLSVVPDEQQQRVEQRMLMQQIAQRVPSQMKRVYDWESSEAHDLFEAINPHVAAMTMTPRELEDLLDMDGLTPAYMQWLGRQS